MQKSISKYLWALALLVAVGVSQSGCYMYHEQHKVVLNGIDIDQTLKVADEELGKDHWTSVLTLWAMRDQVVTAEQAAEISVVYFKHIDAVDTEERKGRKFMVWHITWAISNLYRLGDEGVQKALETAYKDAEKRVEKLDMNLATKLFKDEEIYMGDAHGGGRGYAKKHLVVPGNDKYLQSFDEYLENRKEN
jgi:hypothetical protein